MKLEIIATRVSDAVLAERGGADRIELVTGMLEGGLTPGPGLIEETVKAVSIPVNVMVRPHSLSFVYDKLDLQAMRADIRMIRRSGAAGVVLGPLTPEGTVDEEALKLLLGEAEGLDVTFHRAFDAVRDQLAALEILTRHPAVNRILTSGGQPSALQGMARLRQLVQASAGSGTTILAGSGLTLDALESFLKETGVGEVHFGSAVREGGHSLRPPVPERIAAVKKVLAAATLWID